MQIGLQFNLNFESSVFAAKKLRREARKHNWKLINVTKSCAWKSNIIHAYKRNSDAPKCSSNRKFCVTELDEMEIEISFFMSCVRKFYGELYNMRGSGITYDKAENSGVNRRKGFKNHTQIPSDLVISRNIFPTAKPRAVGNRIADKVVYFHCSNNNRNSF